MAVEGTLDLFKLPEIMQLISQQRKTGILTVQGQQDIVAISFLTGRIVAADALSQTLEEGLAQVLVREGMITASDLHRAAAEHQSAGGRLIDVLVERRYLERAQLLQALRLQTWRLLEQLLRWSEGDFKFYSGDEVSYEEGIDPIAVEELLIHSAPALPAPQALPPPARPAPAPSPPPASAPAPRAAAPAPLPPPVPISAPRPVPRPAAPQPPSPAPATAAPPPVVPFGDETGQFRQMKVEPRPPAPLFLPWVGRALAGLLALLVVGSLWRVPDSVIIPFSWQERERAALARDQRAALYLKIDRAAKTWFLLKGSFPDRLEELVQTGLLSRDDLKDPEGHSLRYAAGEESYTLQPVAGGKPVPGAEASEAITGNFLLDPEVLNVPPESQAAPLVLLD
ncbi:MAG TPA: DUF4388 domain-containing protein [Thermoanaerobaculia bacterium]|jgi:hypothetical protein|nr:DUF4388 domain-containing protein [Thermoanaerobaculia bacterium]